jgi:hypothetical protein
MQSAPTIVQNVLPVIDDPCTRLVPWPTQTAPARMRAAPTTRLAIVTNAGTSTDAGRFSRRVASTIVLGTPRDARYRKATTREGRVPEAIEFISVSPIIPVLDLDAALDRFQRLGFSTELEEGPRYGFAERSHMSLHLIEWSDHDRARTGAHVYLYVSDADALHEEWSSAEVEGELEA